MNIKEKLFVVLIVGYSLIILLLDYVSPIEISFGSLYIIVIVASSFLIESRKKLYFITFICCLLIFTGYFFSSSTDYVYSAGINRILSVFIALLGCIMGAMYMTVRIKERSLNLQFQQAMEAAPNAMVMVNSSGNIVFSNKAMQSLFGYKEHELLNTNIDELVPKTFRGHHKKYRNEFLSNPKPRAMGKGRDLYGLCKDGSQVPIEIGLTPIRTTTGLFIVSAIVDLTERRKSQEELVSLNSKISTKNVELEQFVYTVSHDLKAPLVSISGFSKKLKRLDEISINKDASRYLERIISNVDKMEELIKDLLDLSRVTHQELLIEEIDLQSIYQQCLEIMHSQIKISNASINLKNKLPKMYGQRNLLLQVFSNLFANAIKYSQEGVAPVITIDLEDSNENSFLLSIKDNGIGIAEEYYDKVFEIFERLIPEKCEGSGVGLAIVKKVVEKHAGKIWLESERNNGTTFYVWFPRELCEPVLS